MGQTKYIDSLESLIQSGISGKEEAKVLISLSFAFQDHDFEKSIQYGKQAIEVSKKGEYHDQEIKALVQIGRSYLNQHQYKKAKNYLDKALKATDDFDCDECYSDCFNALGIYYYEKGNFNKALFYYQKEKEVYEKFNKKASLAGSYNNIANALESLGRINEAIDYFFKALKLFEEQNAQNNQAITLNNIAVVYDNQNEYEKAKIYFKKAITINKKNKYNIELEQNYNNLGVAFRKTQMYDSALFYYQKAVQINKSLNYPGSLARNYLNIGNLYKDKREYNKAKDYYTKSLKICDTIGIYIGMAYNYIGFAELEKSQGNYKQALNYAQSARDYLLKSGEAKSWEMLYDLFYNIYLEQEDYKNALNYYIKRETIKDSISNSEIHIQINDLQSKYDLEKEQQLNDKLELKNKLQKRKLFNQSLIIGISLIIVISLVVIIINARRIRIKDKKHRELLEAKNKEIKQKAESLSELVATKDKLFSIIGHDLKNPFNAIMGFSNLLTDDYENLSDEQRIKYLNHISNATNKATNLLENLLIWSSSQKGEIKIKLEEIGVEECINEQVEIYKNAIKHKNITIENKVNTQQKIMSDRNMVCLVFRNILNNAVKFSNKEGKIFIGFQQDSNYVTISIKDEGVGMNEEVLQNLFSLKHNITTKGTLDETGTGLGLVICKEFIDKLNGKIWAESEENNGSTFYFSLPISQ